MELKYVCFNITSQCNMKCPYCYRVGSSLGNCDLQKAKEYIDFLVKQGCETISITGGEPLINRQWKDIIKYCAEKELFTILSTNGLDLNIFDNVLQHVNVLSLPLDGGTELVNSKTRSKGHFSKVNELIKDYVVGDFQFKLKINTVITRYNYKKLDELLSILNNEKIIWKIFELREKGEFYNFPKKDIICSEDALKSASLIMAKDHKCSIYYMGEHSDTVNTVNPNYFVLNYNGDMYLADESKNQFLFNIDSGFDHNTVNKLDPHLLNNQYQEELKNDFTKD